MIQLVLMLRWRNWLGKGNGSDVLDPVSASVPGGVVVSFICHLQVAKRWLKESQGVTI